MGGIITRLTSVLPLATIDEATFCCGGDMKEVFEFLAHGGVVMIPIALGSIIALAIFLERIWTLQESRIIPRGLLDHVIKLLSEGDKKKAREECLKSNTPLGRLLLAGIDSGQRKREETRGILEEVGRHEVSRTGRYIEAMGTIASVEPLMGLLGTVTGMIKVFQKVTEMAHSINPKVLASGIWQALITTAAGLSVAIIAFVGYRYLLSRMDRWAVELENGAVRLMDQLYPVKNGDEE